jgi:hypothetical protein
LKDFGRIEALKDFYDQSKNEEEIAHTRDYKTSRQAELEL